MEIVSKKHTNTQIVTFYYHYYISTSLIVANVLKSKVENQQMNIHTYLDKTHHLQQLLLDS